jgi:L-seryl-tRNA(Ser) seleniumtransferase
MASEPTIQESIAAGADLALFSGDKLLGGPQCGVIAGRSELVATLRRHPLARALRVDKLTIAALNATLLSYVEGREAREIPVWRMVSEPLDQIQERAAPWARAVDAHGSVISGRSMVGGGSLPGEGVATWCAAIATERPDEFARLLRENAPPVIARVHDGKVLLDPRTVDPADDAVVVEALRGASTKATR